MTDIANLTQKLVDARKGRVWSQKDLADKLNMKQSQISEIEAGKRDPRIGTIIEVARALGLEVVLVPRHLLPAVSYVLQPVKAPQSEEPRAIYDFWEEEDAEHG